MESGSSCRSGASDGDDLEWEEWDGRSPFLHHCLAGSVAGIAEHTLMYPFDTVKTHMQSYCADCPLSRKQSNLMQDGANAQATALSKVKTGKNGFHKKNMTYMKKIDPSGTRASPQHVFHGGGVSPMSSVGAGPSHMHPPPHPQQHGMWRTMTNLIYYGYPNYHSPLHQLQPKIEHNSLVLGKEAPAAAVGKAGSNVTTTAAADFMVGTRAVAAQQKMRLGRLWRGVQTMLVGCAPAHAMYFSTYEIVKSLFVVTVDDGADSTARTHVSTVGSAASGAAATVVHDMIMTPLDTIKQRLQLGHYKGTLDAVRCIVKYEGHVGLYRSFPITLLTNMPYGMVMVSTNEFLKEQLNPIGDFDVRTYMMAGSGAGMVAAAVTTPLDRVKTRLQTQLLGSVFTVAAIECDGVPYGAKCTKAQGEALAIRSSAKYDGFVEAFRSIVREEGPRGLFRGMIPRLVTHTPAVAISWTSYESAKKWLQSALD